MDAPPRISEAPAREVPIEVLPPEGRAEAPPKVEVEGAPIHALSALILVAVDNLWNLAEWAVVDWVFTIPLSFITVFVPVFLLQKYLKKDSNGRALAFAMLLGVLAAVPTSITGTPVGLGLLAWTGLRKMMGKGETKK
jgi:hypothetical protein